MSATGHARRNPTTADKESRQSAQDDSRRSEQNTATRREVERGQGRHPHREGEPGQPQIGSGSRVSAAERPRRRLIATRLSPDRRSRTLGRLGPHPWPTAHARIVPNRRSVVQGRLDAAG
ncbi:hypothetical protein, partial [Paractinoplanes brasiliensis]|uniref:hypothetical protein n=1 Tax=Paractinoplanes brasiliensis TaxID=52695 RepID=UPI001EF28978